MKITFLFLYLNLFVAGILHAQYSHAVDSLFDLADAAHEDHLDDAIGYAQEVYQIGVREKDTVVIANALDYLGFYQDRKGNYKEAIRVYTESAELKKMTGDTSLAWTYSEIGFCYMMLGEYPDAKKYIQLGIDLSKQVKEYFVYGLSIFRLGQIEFRSGDLRSAMSHYEESLHIGDSIKNLFVLYHSLARLSDIYLSLTNSDKAKVLAVRALAVADSLGDRRQVADAYDRMGVWSEQTGDLEGAEKYYKKALEVSEAIEHMRGVQDGYISLGDLAVVRGQYTQALELFRQAKKVELSNRIVQSNLDHRIGSVYYDLNKLDSAFFYSLRAYQAGEELHAPLQQYKPAKLLYQIYKQKGMPAKALYYYEVYNAISDSISTDEFEKELIRKDYNYRIVNDSIEFAKAKEIKDLELAGKEIELKSQRRQKMGFLGMGVLAIIISILAVRSLQQKKKANRIIAAEKEEAELQRKRSDELLLNILPSETAEELKRTGEAQARQFNEVTVLFTDFKEFTSMSEKMDPHQLVSEINHCFSAFDQIVEKYKVEKIKTIGDAYMAAGGLPVVNETHAVDVVNAALDIQQFMQTYAEQKQATGDPFFKIRIGIHTGPVVAGIVGIKKFQYDIWGDTVNTASRMESSSEDGRVNISQMTYTLIKDQPGYHFEKRGMITAKGKGEMEMWYVTRAKENR